jgi:hypothetical protein
MAEHSVKLHDGRELEIDLHRITIGEWRELFEPATEYQREDEIIGKVVGLAADEIVGLSRLDYQDVMRAVIKASQRPLDDPKVPQSESS